MPIKSTNHTSFLPKTLLLTAAFLFLSGQFFAQVTKQVAFTTTSSEQTWTVPGGVTEVTIECWGGGGGGGYIGTNNNAGAGGGGGAYSKKTLSVEPCKPITIQVGKGGAGRSSSNSEEDAIGGDSYAKYDGSTVILAKGGKGGAQGSYSTYGMGGKSDDGIGDTKYSGGHGGTGSTGSYAGSGGGGAAAGRTGDGGNGGNGAKGDVIIFILVQAHPGDAGQIQAGSTYSGNGAQGVYVSLLGSAWTDVEGKAGDTYGGGGSGMAAGWAGSVSGGNGAQGYVLITYTVPEPMSVDNMTATTCSGKPFSVTPTGSNIYPNTTYSWSAPYVSGISGTAAGTNQTTVNGTLINSYTDDVDVTYNVTASACDSTANFTVTVTVKGILFPGSIGVNIISCNEGDTSKQFVNVTPGIGSGQYLWAMSTDNVNWSIINGETDKNYTPIYAVYPGVTYYKRGFYSDCDTVYSNVLTMTYPGTIFPGNVISTQAQKYCKDSTVTALLSTDGITVQSGTSYSIQWQKSNDNGTTWNNIPDSVNNTFHVNIPHLTSAVSYRYTITLAGCTDSIVSNNQWDYSLFKNPVINKLFAQDSCPENTEFYISADITPGDAPVTLYKWNSSISYGTYSADTIRKGSFTPACGELYQSTLMVKDTNGCVSDTAFTSFKTPILTLSDIPDQAAKLNPGECKYVIPNMKDTIVAHFNVPCGEGMIQSYTCKPAEGSYIAFNTSTIDTIVVQDICGNEWTKYVTITAPTLPDLDPADFTFDDSNDTITLFYGFSDTLYNVQIPQFSTTSEYKDTLVVSNNRNDTANTGAILGRLTVGTDTTITWKLSDPCGHSITFLKHYIVVYPQCGSGYTVTDNDGYEYETVRLGNECWTKPNLKTTPSKGYSFFYQNNSANLEKYGRLYSWYAAVGLEENSTSAPATITDPDSHISYVQGICPEGWGLPTTASFESLYLSAGEDVSNLKSSSTKAWLADITGTDATGFSAVGAGYFYKGESPYFFDLLGEAFFWTSEGAPIEKKGKCCSITLTCPKLLYYSTDAGMGYSIRCVKRKNN